MKIALCHFRVGETDGVSLEMDKWKSCLESLGHQVYYIAGSEGNSQCFTIDELYYLNPVNDKIVRNAYQQLIDYYAEDEFIAEIETIAGRVEQSFISYFEMHDIDVVVPNNIFSLGWNLPVAIGLYNAIVATDTRCVCHHHDFYWERDRYSHPTIAYVDQVLEKYFPPKHPLFTHVVINQLAKKELKARKGITGIVVANAFDFYNNQWKSDDYNGDLRKSIGIGDHDLMVLQATRIVPRKGIELAIDFVAELSLPGNLKKIKSPKENTSGTLNKIHLVLAGLNESGDYYDKLRNHARELNVHLLDIGSITGHSRAVVNGEKKYSLWDAYVHCDLITYPSLLEGWGNQFIEGINAKKLMIVYEYPVFESDIKPYEFNYISLGNRSQKNETGLVELPRLKLKKAVNDTIVLLNNPLKKDILTAHNYEIGTQHFSYTSLTTLLKKLFI